MAMFVNYDGLTYEWNYGPCVIVKDGKIEVDAFSLPVFEDVRTDTFLRGVVLYSDYLEQAHLYSSENMS